MAPFFLASAELADNTTSRLPATWTSLNPTCQGGLLAKEAPLDSGTGLLCTLKWNPVFGPGFATTLSGKRLSQAPWKTVAKPVP